ncbi:MAG: acyl-CoA reductase [Flavobacteriaceae bacterium]|nr:acyl-CoA reductase [Flavobacteriaceae bacterium]
MTLAQRISAFEQLGNFMRQFSTDSFEKQKNVLYNDTFFETVQEEIYIAVNRNAWFTLDNVIFAFKSWSESLTQSNLEHWTKSYQFYNNQPKTIGLIMAGNIPLVGFHDFLAVLISGHKALVKLSSNDQKLLPILAQYLQIIEPEFKDFITFIEQKIENFDAVIATGSNNSARYFEYYFGKYPHIIRKNRNSVAILTGNETDVELELLGEDVFRYFGLGCRSVSKIFIPKNYDLDKLFKAFYPFHTLLDYKKYSNNYDYNKAVYLMSLFKIYDNGFLVLKEDKSYASPIASLFYEYYDTLDSLNNKFESEQDQIQCIISNSTIKNSIPFGSSQKPNLWDYADEVDTIEFLLKLT